MTVSDDKPVRKILSSGHRRGPPLADGRLHKLIYAGSSVQKCAEGTIHVAHPGKSARGV